MCTRRLLCRRWMRLIVLLVDALKCLSLVRKLSIFLVICVRTIACSIVGLVDFSLAFCFSPFIYHLFNTLYYLFLFLRIRLTVIIGLLFFNWFRYFSFVFGKISPKVTLISLFFSVFDRRNIQILLLRFGSLICIPLKSLTEFSFSILSVSLTIAINCM